MWRQYRKPSLTVGGWTELTVTIECIEREQPRVKDCMWLTLLMHDVERGKAMKMMLVPKSAIKLLKYLIENLEYEPSGTEGEYAHTVSEWLKKLKEVTAQVQFETRTDESEWP
jgi:hypothetical protein